jgi:CxxC motif-containing protein (DUF1111 family)
MSIQSVNHPAPLYKGLAVAVSLAAWLFVTADAFPQVPAVDPGVRIDPPGAGDPLLGLSDGERAFFEAGKKAFGETEGVDEGLGPCFNGDSCVSCHAQPAMGGTSPAVNPQVAMATALGGTNTVPSFITVNGPVREVRFVRSRNGTADGGVHQLFVITGRADAPLDCNITQEDFETQLARRNVVFRIPTPVFGAGLIEAIADADIVANLEANTLARRQFGIGGRVNRLRTGRAGGYNPQPNRSGNDGTVTRFGWKAQNKSLLIFSGEAYNVEQGITNELFPTETDETPACASNAFPEDQTDFDAPVPAEASSDALRFSHFMRFLAPPTPAPDDYLPGIAEGRTLFSDIGCALCHTPSFTTRPSSVTALNEKPVNLYSDLALHAMGAGLADGISQGDANGDEFRTAPLWGLGQRIFFLHDGRTSDLSQAIQAHWSRPSAGYSASEANAAIDSYNRLSEEQKQQVLNFLRSL